ncbi:hypothetical protein [Streptomyces sp. NPDC090022]
MGEDGGGADGALQHLAGGLVQAPEGGFLGFAGERAVARGPVQE